MKKQSLISLIVSAVIVAGGSAGAYAIHESYAAGGGSDALLAGTVPGTSTASSSTGSAAGDSAGTPKSDSKSDSADPNTETPSGNADADNPSSGTENKEDSGQSIEDGKTEEPTLKEIISSVSKKVVMIETEDGSLGSGFLYNDRGDILTNAHVVAGYKDVTVTTSDSVKMDGKIIGIGEETDVAVVRVPDLEKVEPLKLKLKAEAEIGDQVLALGSPLGLQNTVTTGIVSGVDRTFDIAPYYYEGLYQISAPIAPGNSGGPLVDQATGEVLGINSAVTDEGGIGFSIPVTSVIEAAKGWSDKPMEEIPMLDYGDGSDIPADDYYGDEYGDDGYDDSYDDVPVDGTELEYQAEDVLYAFYDAVSRQDYEAAYGLLGEKWQAKQSYEDFAGGYKDTLGVYLDHCLGVENGDGTVSVYISITADERTDNGAVSETYDLVYQVGSEPGDASDVLKIISGKSQY
ncbi:serine protease [Saccharibacillus sp. O23]|uniref:S1C family serine protease n=1 Tax=Saccharibacillus sp. O23 TaxID=2009338 RepID=UPI000B4E258B|nr:trypsin-like peptidase domain-containing protein [Saccharibacillus sp. O23]OWR31151.1 serine protease [Saccharibacillus sp. O23]